MRPDPLRVLALLAVGMFTVPLHAQDTIASAHPVDSTSASDSAFIVATPALMPGQILRLSRRHMQLTEGTLRERRGDTLVIVSRLFRIRHEWTLDTAHIVYVRGTHASRVQSALVGGAMGAALSVVMAASIVSSFGGSLRKEGHTVGELTLVILPVGVGSGMLAGALTPPYRWMRVTLTRAAPK